MKTPEKLKSHLVAAGHSAMAANRVLRLMAEFATPEAFFAAGRGLLEQTYNKLTPGSAKGLGAGFFRAFDDALAWWRMPECGKNDVVRAADPVFTTAQLKSVLDFCEMFSKESIALSEVLSVLTMIDRGDAEAAK